MNLKHSKSEQLTKFLPLILDKLIALMVKPTMLDNQPLNISQTVFEAITSIVRNITVSKIMSLDNEISMACLLLNNNYTHLHEYLIIVYKIVHKKIVVNLMK